MSGNDLHSARLTLNAHNAWEASIKSAISYISLPTGTGWHQDEDVTLFIGLQSVVDNIARQHPGFPLPFNKTQISQSFAIRQTPTMGLGMFSKHGFQAGDIIVRERPLMVCLDSIDLLLFHPSRSCLAIRRVLSKIIMRGRLQHMTSTNRDAFSELSKHYHFDDMPPLHDALPDLYIFAANAFNVIEEPDGMKYRAVMKYASRINHSCSPNALWLFDQATFSFIVTAVRKIAPDEQIFVPYCNLDVPRSVRQESLEPYGIEPCSCSSCTTGGVDSDERRQTITRLVADGYELLKVSIIQDRHADWAHLLRVHQNILKEGLECESAYPLLLHAIGHYWQRLRKPHLAEPMIRGAAIQYSIRRSAGERLRVSLEPLLSTI